VVVGLTGNYGMGKSTVLSMFRKFGVITLDSDKIVESLLLEKDVHEKIRELLGDEVFDNSGSLDKKKIADLVFKNSKLRNFLEEILHPLIFKKIKDFIDKINEKDKVVVVEVPLLYERGYKDRFDRAITVHTKEAVALDRLEKNGVNKDEAILRLRAQLPIEEKVKQADFVIDNNGTTEETMAQVEMVYKKLLREVEDGDN
jgi:dephospho-CoA kinase